MPTPERTCQWGQFGHSLIAVCILLFHASCFAATRIWDGGGPNANWMTAANWVGDVAPSPGDTLVFPAGGLQSSNTNDFPSGTLFYSIDFSGANYAIFGAPMLLHGGITSTNTAGNNRLLMSLTLSSNDVIPTVQIAGPMTIGGSISGNAVFAKTGDGALTLTRTNTYTGPTLLKQGSLEVNGQQPASPILFSGGSGSACTLRGSGRIGTIAATGGSFNVISPGTFGPGVLSCSDLALNPSVLVVFDLDGTTPGAGHDQLTVTGTVNLGSASLSFTLGYQPPLGDAFQLISNDGTDPVVGTFRDLPEGRVFTNSAVPLQITYAGGDGNDVVLTRVSFPARLTGIARLPDGRMQIQGLGQPGSSYSMQASDTPYVTTGWSTLGSATSGPNGVFLFTDTDTPTAVTRFYRAVSP